MLLENIQSAALARAGDTRVSDVRIGLGYTAVMLDTGNVGLSYTFREREEQGCSVFQGRRPLSGLPLRDMLHYVTSAVMLERTVGLASANALLNTFDAVTKLPACETVEGDLLDVLSLTKDDRIGMVGYFAPIVPELKKRAGDLLVFEEHQSRGAGLHDAQDAAAMLPGCSVVILTATAIINGSLEHLAAAACNCRMKVLLGPSTPLAPDIFGEFGFTHLSGVVVADADAIMRIVSEGGGTRYFKKSVMKINVIIDR